MLFWLLMWLFTCFEVQDLNEQNVCIDSYLESINEFAENFEWFDESDFDI